MGISSVPCRVAGVYTQSLRLFSTDVGQTRPLQGEAGAARNAPQSHLITSIPDIHSEGDPKRRGEKEYAGGRFHVENWNPFQWAGPRTILGAQSIVGEDFRFVFRIDSV
jgi:hypothetical protein